MHLPVIWINYYSSRKERNHYGDLETVYRWKCGPEVKGRIWDFPMCATGKGGKNSDFYRFSKYYKTSWKTQVV